MGLKTQEIAVGDNTTIKVVMMTDAIGLDEVVAIGYGSQRKKDMTGSIVNVKAEELEKYQPANVQRTGSDSTDDPRHNDGAASTTMISVIIFMRPLMTRTPVCLCIV